MLIYPAYNKREVVMVLSSDGLKLVKNNPKNDIFDQKKHSEGKSHFLEATLIKVFRTKSQRTVGVGIWCRQMV